LINIDPSQSCFLFGARGTGKTFWIRHFLPHCVYIDLLDDEIYRKLLANPASLSTWIPPGNQWPIVIDEIQKIPPLLDEVHRQIEHFGRKFILTGSSARKLRRGGANLLAGRALVNECYPLTAHEIGEGFDVRERIKYGCLPAVLDHSDPGRFLAAYVNTYLKEEVMAEGIVRNLANFARFMEAASFSQAQILNMATVARDCGVERKVVEQYFQILEDLLLAVRLPVFTRRAKRNMTTHPKFFFFDVGVYRALRPSGPLDEPEIIEGTALESLIFQEIRALNHYQRWEYDLYTWRSRTKLEVDLILYGPRGLHAIEIKRSGRLRDEDLKGLRAFLEDYPAARGHLVYQGEKNLYYDRLQVRPLPEFLNNLEEILA